MFRFEDFEESHFVEFLKQGLLDSHIEEVLNRFHFLTPKSQFELISYLRESLRDSISPRLLAKVFKIPIRDAEKILRGNGKVFQIILVKEGVKGEQPNKETDHCKLCRALLIPDTSRVITNLPHLKPKLSVIRSLFSQNFAIFFEESFTGDSFMLPLAVALGVKKVPPDLLFTGKVNRRGDILEVDHLGEKMACAKALNYRLITPLQVKNLKTIKAFLEKESWDIPFYVTSAGKEEFSNFLERINIERQVDEYDFLKGFQLFYGLTEESFTLYTGQLALREHWERACSEFYQKIYTIANTIPGDRLFHIGVRGAVAFSFALGILFSHFDPFVFYHYQAIAGKVSYHPIEVRTPRVLKERVKDYKLIEPRFEAGEGDLVVVFNFSHHEPSADVKRFVERNLRNPSMVVIESLHKGNLPVDDFLKVAQETASYLQDLRQRYSFERYHFFFSCPVPVAFMIGLAFGHYVDGSIYNYQRDGSSYEEVLDLRYLRKLREGCQKF